MLNSVPNNAVIIIKLMFRLSYYNMITMIIDFYKLFQNYCGKGLKIHKLSGVPLYSVLIFPSPKSSKPFIN